MTAPPGFILALAMARNCDRAVYASGSAVLINERWAFCARHVFDDYWETAEYESRPVPSEGGPHEPSFSIVAMGAIGGKMAQRRWDVTQAWRTSGTDIALLELAPACSDQLAFAFPTLDLTPPEVGLAVTAYGYTRSMTRDHSDGVSTEWADECVSQRGRVTEIFLEKRDIGLLNFPCFSTSALFEHGMSGGAVISDEDGSLVGIVCDGLAPAEGAADYSVACMLWPAMFIDIGSPPDAGHYRLFRAAVEERFACKGRDRLVPEVREDLSISKLRLAYPGAPHQHGHSLLGP